MNWKIINKAKREIMKMTGCEWKDLKLTSYVKKAYYHIVLNNKYYFKMEYDGIVKEFEIIKG